MIFSSIFLPPSLFHNQDTPLKIIIDEKLYATSSHDVYTRHGRLLFMQFCRLQTHKILNSLLAEKSADSYFFRKCFLFQRQPLFYEPDCGLIFNDLLGNKDPGFKVIFQVFLTSSVSNLNRDQKQVLLTCTLDSVNPILIAISSRMKMSVGMKFS